MNRCRPYRFVHPLRGCGGTRGNALGYRDASPNGDKGCNQHLGARHVSATTPPRWEDYRHTVFTAPPPQCADATTTLHSPFSILNSSFSHTFSAKERDAETGLSYFGARYYSSALSIWLSVDPMSDKYPSLSPYTYCANNPIRIIDPSGDSCAVLLAGKAVYGAGHMAILIQNKDKQWELYSKNGDDDGDPKTFSGEVRGTPDDQPCVDRETGGVKSWGSVQDFLDDPDYNTVNHDGEGGTYYTEAYVLPTTQNQDDIIRDGMKKSWTKNITY